MNAQEIVTRQRQPIVIGVGIILLIILAYGAFASNMFQPPQQRVTRALAALANSGQRTAHVQFQLDPKDTNVSSTITVEGDGMLITDDQQLPRFDGSATMRIRRKGIELVMSALLKTLKGVVYWKFTELPAAPDVAKTLEGTWFHAGTEQQQLPPQLTPDAQRQLFTMIGTADLLSNVQRHAARQLNNVAVQEFSADLKQDTARRLLDDYAKRTQNAMGKNTAAFLSRTLETYRVEGLTLDVTRATGELAQLSFALVPNDERSAISRMTVTVALSPVGAPTATITAPESSQAFDHPELFLRLFQFH